LSTPVGNGCPRPAAFHEQFLLPGTSDLAGRSIRLVRSGLGWNVEDAPGAFDPDLGVDLGLADDQLVGGLALGFDFPLPTAFGGGSTGAIDVDSNGWIGLISGRFLSSDFSESAIEFLAGPPRIAAYWDDFNPAFGGGVYFGTTPGGSARVTWNGVPQFGATDSNTFQVQFFPNGDLVLAWQQVSDDGLVGISAGGIDSVVLPIDLTASLPFPFSEGGSRPLVLTASRPTIGGEVVLAMESPPAAASYVIHVGLAEVAIDLRNLGASGCVLRTVPISVLSPQVSPTVVQARFPLPVDPFLVGVQFMVQGAALDPSLNALGAVVSNGVRLRIGR
jgi:hypothetical protein